LNIISRYIYINNTNYKEIYNWLLYNQNNPNFIFLLGYFNYYGIGTTKDMAKAFILFLNASERDHTLAQFYAGLCCDLGHGITRNEKLALEYYEKVANKNYVIGQFRLVLIYKNRISVEKILGLTYKNEKSVKKDFKIAAYWLEKAANNGHSTAIYDLGCLYFNGNGVKSDIYYQKAFELFKKSAEEEYSDGIMMLGYCYCHGVGINIDREKAVELYQKAANLGNGKAQYYLAISYEKGNGTEKDIDKAIYWYIKSARQGDLWAQERLEKLKARNNKIT
jgi:TPR repeat protein